MRAPRTVLALAASVVLAGGALGWGYAQPSIGRHAADPAPEATGPADLEPAAASERLFRLRVAGLKAEVDRLAAEVEDVRRRLRKVDRVLLADRAEEPADAQAGFAESRRQILPDAAPAPPRAELLARSPEAEPRAAPAGAPAADPQPEPAPREVDAASPGPTVPPAQEANPTDATVDLVVGLRLGEQFLAEVPVRITPEDVVVFPVEDFLRPLREILDPEVVAALEAAADADGRLTVTEARAAGLETVYDPGLLELQVAVAAEQRDRAVISLRGERDGPVDFADQSLVAGFVTGRLGTDYVSESENGETGREPLGVALESALRLFGEDGIAILAEADYLEDTDPDFQRGDVRAVYDLPERAWRLTAGDLDFEISRLQAADDILGLSFEQTFRALQPRRNTRPIGRREFFLEREATVEVIVNGRPVRTLRLDPGRYDIRDFPFVTGTNDVQIVVEDALSRREVLDFSLSFANELLEVGLSEFSYAAGIASDDEDGGISYDADRPVLSFFHRRGVLENLTLGLNGQGDLEQQILGGEAIAATPIGNFAFDVAASRVDEVGRGAAAIMDYELPFPNGDRQRRLTFGAAYRGERFAALGDIEPDNDTLLDLDLGYSQDLGLDVRGSLSASFGLGRGDDGNPGALALGLSRTFLDDLTLVLQAQYTSNADGEEEVALLVSASYRINRAGRLRFRHDTSGSRTRLDYTYTGSGAVGGFGGSIGVERSGEDDEVGLVGEVDYIGNRFEFGAAHDIVTRGLDGDEREQITRVNVESTLAFADDRFAVGRPIRGDGSFAILYRHPSLASNGVEISPSRKGPEARIDLFGPALVSTQPYVDEQIEVEVDDLPIGYDLGGGRFDLKPYLASGHAIQIGSAASVTVLGTMLDPAGEPLALIGGQALSTDEPDATPVTVLTNRAGRFVAQPLAPGRYRVRMFSRPPLTTIIEVGEDAVGLVDVGTVTMTRE